MTRDRSLFAGIVVVGAAALLARLLFLLEFSSVPLFDSPTMDMLYHDQWARDILGGRGAAYAPFFRAPLYPYFLALVYLVFGSGGWAVGIAQSLLGSASAVLVFLIGRRILGHGPGLVAGFVTALWGTLIFYEPQRLAVGLAMVLNLAALYVLLCDDAGRSRATVALGGLCLGLSAIAHPTILLFAGVYAVWLLAGVRRRAAGVTLAHAALYLAALAAPIVPVTVYNWAVSGQRVVIGTYSGLNFYIGNHRGSDGISAQLPGLRQDWWGMMEDAASVAGRESGRTLNESEQASFWWRKAALEVRGDPLEWLALMSRKTLFLLQGIELSNNIDFYYFAHRSRLLHLLVQDGPLFVPWGLFITPALIGLVIGLRQSSHMRLLTWFVLAYGVGVVLFFVTARYRLPLVPAVALLAVSGAQFLLKTWRQKSAAWRAGAIVLIALGYVVTNVDFFRHAPRSEAPGLFSMAAAYERIHEVEKAEHYYRAAVTADPTFVQAYNDLGLLQITRGDLKGAIETLSAGGAAAPGHPTVLYNLAYAHLLAGEAEPAVPLLRAVLAAQPDNLDAWNNLGTAFNLAGRFDSAQVWYQRILKREPSFQAARFGLGWALQEEGQLDSARACFLATASEAFNVAESHYRIAQSWIAEGQADSAIASLKACLRRLEAEQSDAKGEVKTLLDSLLGKQGRIPAARGRP